jgi:hypothetical protein
VDHKDREALLAGTFEMPLADCELRQHGVAEPKVYSGPALLSQRSDKSLVLRLFGQPRSQVEGLMTTFAEHAPGKLYPDSSYYDFVGVDHGGVTWKADRMGVSFSFGTNSTFVTASVRQIEGREPYGKMLASSTAHAVVPGVFEFPWHVATTTETSISTDRFEGETDLYAWKLRKQTDRLDILFTVKDGPVGEDFYRFLAALSVLCGRAIEPVVITIGERGERIRRLKSQRRPNWTAKLVPPVSQLRPDATHAHRFISAYLTGTRQLHPVPVDHLETLHSLWHQTLRTANDFEIGGLVLGVNIESMLVDCFLSDVDVDEQFIEDVEKAKEILKKSEMPERARNRAMSSLGSATKPGPRQVLMRIQEQGFIEAAHVDAWRAMRNHAAHGGDVDATEPGAAQGAVDKFYTCLDLFYRLLFVVIGYRGTHHAFAAEGWPLVSFGVSPATAELAKVESPLPKGG